MYVNISWLIFLFSGSLRLLRGDFLVLFKLPARPNIFLQVTFWSLHSQSEHAHLKLRCESIPRLKITTMSPCGHSWFQSLQTSHNRTCRFSSRKKFYSMEQVRHRIFHLTTNTFLPERFLFQVICKGSRLGLFQRGHHDGRISTKSTTGHYVTYVQSITIFLETCFTETHWGGLKRSQVQSGW